jgi:HEAT repeat protein
MSARSSQKNDRSKVRWSFIAVVCLVAIAVCGFAFWLKPPAFIKQTADAASGTLTPENSRSPGTRTQSRRIQSGALTANPASHTRTGHTDRMAALAANVGMIEEVEKAIQEVVTLGNSVVPELEQLIGSGQAANVREAAARALAEIGTPESVSILLQAVSAEQNDDHRRALVSALHALNNPEAAEELATALIKDQDSIVFPTIRDTLARIADDAATQTIANTFHNAAQEGWQQSNLMGALARVRSSDAVPALRNIVFADSDSSLRSQAAISLGLIGTQDAIQALLDAIDQSQSVSLTTVFLESLGAVNNKASLPDLVSLLNQSTNENVRYAAATALGNISSQASANALNAALNAESSHDIRQTIEASLARLGQANNSQEY